MADDSPGKVQALRAIFSENNKPLMGMMPPGGKIPNRPWRTVVSCSEDSTTTTKDKKFNELRLGNRVLPIPDKNMPKLLNGETQKDLNGYGERSSRTVPKPLVGPKPSYLLQQQLKTTTLESASTNATVLNNDSSRQSDGLTSQSKTKAFGETIASFMFTPALHKENDRTVSDSNSENSAAPPPIPKPRTSQLQNCLQNHVNIMNLCNSNGVVFQSEMDSQCCNISSDNYICKSSVRMRRRELPSVEKLGPAPLKPLRPPHIKLPSKYSSSSSNVSGPPQEPPPTLPQRPVPQRPSYPCPPRPQTPPPLPPILAPVIKPSPVSLREEVEELYEDTIQGERERPVSLIPEYTEEEEQAEELYNDAEQEVEVNSISDSPLKYKKPPPPIPSEYLQPNNRDSIEELYQDANEIDTEEVYEVMPCDEIPESEYGSPLYSNNKKEIEKMKKEEEKRIRKEQKEREKKDKELEKLRKKFGLTGEEIPIDDGLVKCDSRGGKGDLPVRKGETVLILRMEGNPSGRWLVKNEKGKIGYVELTNIEVDPLSVKSVMSIRRLSVISNGEELYCEAKSEEEAIYEVTY